MLYKVRITPYLLAEWNGHLGGDVIELTSQQIEHVLPENPDESLQWVIDWTKEERELRIVWRTYCLFLGNLNRSIQSADCAEKCQRYIDDSVLKAPCTFGNKYLAWTPVEFNERAEELAEWALSR